MTTRNRCTLRRGKRLLTLVLTAALLLSCFAVNCLAVTVDEWGDSHERYDEDLYGDINSDYQVNAVDYMLLKRAVLGTYALSSDEQKRAADIDQDGEVTAFDYLLLKRSVIGTRPMPGLIVEELHPNFYASLTDEELYARIDETLASDPNPEGANILAVAFQRIKRETQGAAVLGSLGFSDDFEDPVYLNIGRQSGIYLYVVIEVPPEQLREAIFKLCRCEEVASCSIHGNEVSFPC